MRYYSIKELVFQQGQNITLAFHANRASVKRVADCTCTNILQSDREHIPHYTAKSLLYLNYREKQLYIFESGLLWTSFSSIENYTRRILSTCTIWYSWEECIFSLLTWNPRSLSVLFSLLSASLLRMAKHYSHLSSLLIYHLFDY